MSPLDLRSAPPRAPTAALGGWLFLPRTIDKARGLIPGGRLGAYTLTGLSEMMLERLRVEPHRFVAAVRFARSDDEVASWLGAHGEMSGGAAWNAWLLSRRIEDLAHRVRLARRYPIAADPRLSRIVDVLAADDELMLAQQAGERVAS